MAAIHLAAIGATSISLASPSSLSRRSYALKRSSFILNEPGIFLRSVHAKNRRGGFRYAAVSCSVRKLSEAELLPLPVEDLKEKIPSGAGVYGVYDGNGELQFIGISRNIAGSIDFHRKTVPDLCHSVRVIRSGSSFFFDCVMLGDSI